MNYICKIMDEVRKEGAIESEEAMVIKLLQEGVPIDTVSRSVSNISEEELQKIYSYFQAGLIK